MANSGSGNDCEPLSSEEFKAGVLGLTDAIAKIVQASLEAIAQSAKDSSAAIAQVVQANSTEHAIDHGAAKLAAILEPLRILSTRTALEKDEREKLKAIHATLARPSDLK